MAKLKRAINVLINECRQRGGYHFFVMYLSNLGAIFRGIKYKIFYFKNISGGIFSVQARTKFDIFSKNSKIIIKPFVFIRRNGTIRIDHNGEIYIGDKVFINDNCSINCINKITIDEYTKIGPNVSINDNDHNFRGKSEDRMLKGEVIIGKNVWIGANSVILRNTVIGDNAVIAAGSVVKGEVPANTVFVDKREKILIQYKK
ncbi:acyltransferase [Clostridium sp. D53t1_180928_C8]|uniref:acyltransferase n=1 Tax=Clostridium sp. D53t1_180928_C8 TaxID=2787101 RepID=UPI001FAB5025|nr:acyltransferase [Clostridium sp. D53t1_180928_C8]